MMEDLLFIVVGVLVMFPVVNLFVVLVGLIAYRLALLKMRR